MTTLKRYVLKQFLKIYGLTIGGLIGIFVIIDAFERMDEFVLGQGTVKLFLLYYIYKIPFIFFFMAPQSVLLATVVTLATLSKNNEFIAMKSCGISVTGITLPILSASVIIALGVVSINEFITPITSQRMNHLYYIKVRGAQDKADMARNNLWHRSTNGSIWNINYYDPPSTRMRGVNVIYYDDNQAMIRRRIEAAEAFWDGKQWVFERGFIRLFQPSGAQKTEFFTRKPFPLLETPEDFRKIQKRPEEMSARDIYQNILSYETEGVDTSRSWVDLYQKLSYPFISVVLALVGIPVALRSSRHGGLLFSVAMCLVMGFAFSFLYALGISLGHGGTFHPALAAWGPSLFFIGLGLYMLLTLDSEKLLPI